MIDLRSDTCSTPTDAMRKAMAAAPVGDDVYGDDPSVKALERETAALLGKEDAVYVPTGTMANQIALRVHAQGDEILCEASAHVHLYEGGGASALSGISLRHIAGRRGLFGPEDVDPLIRKPGGSVPAWLIPPTRLLAVENTHNAGGGTVWPLAQLRAVADRARHHGLAVHMDGARLWHAVARTGTDAAAYAATVDTVSVCFSKGLGAPVGSALAGTADFVAKARRFKQMFGGGMRQSGIVAAGALHALERHRDRLMEDHANAARFAEALAAMPGIDLDPETVETNIVYFGLTAGNAPDFCAACLKAGLHMLPMGPAKVRAVFYLNIDEGMTDKAVSIVRGALAAS